jgi:hypothetical protein
VNVNDDLMKRVDELAEATAEAAVAEQLVAGRLEELVTHVSVLAGAADDWQTRSVDPDAQKHLREIGEKLERIADAAMAGGGTEDRLREIAEALAKIAEGEPGQTRETDRDRLQVYDNAQVIARRLRYRAEPIELPEVVGTLARPALRANDAVGRIADDGSFTPTLDFRRNHTVAVYGQGLDHVTEISLDGGPVEIKNKTSDYLFFKVPQNVNPGVVDLKFEVDGKDAPRWTRQLTVS